MITATVLAIFIVPVLFVLIEGVVERRKTAQGKKKRGPEPLGGPAPEPAQ
jgi:hypothetical protein